MRSGLVVDADDQYRYGEGQDGWTEPVYDGGLTYAQAEQVAEALTYANDPIGR